MAMKSHPHPGRIVRQDFLEPLGLTVTVNHRDPGGSVQISYKSLEQLDEVMRRLARSA